nr:MAG TPA: hypothetical protein [Caudoviricetes sp.]
MQRLLRTLLRFSIELMRSGLSIQLTIDQIYLKN